MWLPPLLLSILLTAASAVEAAPLTLDALFLEGTHDGPEIPDPVWIEGGRAFLMRGAGGEDGEARFDRVDARSGAREEWLRLRLPDGAEIDALLVAPGERHLLALSHRRERWRDSALHDHWLVERRSGEAIRLSPEGGEIHARFSPDGRRVAWVRSGVLYGRELDGETTRALATPGAPGARAGDPDWVYEEEFDVDEAWWWSPDSRRVLWITFDDRALPEYPIVQPTEGDYPSLLRVRYPKAGHPNSDVSLHVVEVDSGEERQLDAIGGQQGYLPRAGWLPDGSGVWWIRLERSQRRLELLHAPLAGEPRVVLEERADSWLELDDGPLFLDDSLRFLWRSERSGFHHLYLYDLEGRLHRTLTAGEWNVRRLRAVDREHALLVTDRPGPLFRVVERLRLRDGQLVTLGESTGWHEVEPSPDAAVFLDTVEGIDRRPRLELRGLDGTRRAVVVDDPMEDLGGVPWGATKFLTIPGPEDETLSARMLLPPGFDPQRRYPVVVYAYGGPGSQLVRDRWGGKTELFHRYLSQQGYVVFTLDGRGTGARGRAYKALLHRRLGALEAEDQAAGIRYLRSLPYVDAERIAIWGWSYGGYVATRTLLRHPELLAAGMAVAPVSDWRLYDAVYTERYMDHPDNNPEGYAAASLLPEAGRLRRPLLLVHGLVDDNVHPQHSLRLVSALQEAQRDFELMVYPDKQHSLRGRGTRRHLYGLLEGFLDRHLRLPVGEQP